MSGDAPILGRAAAAADASADASAAARDRSRDLVRRIPRGAARLARAVPRLRRSLLSAGFRLEGGPWRSATAREVMSTCFDVEIGAYSYGGCFEAGAFPPGTRIGRYVSVAEGVVGLGRNHPLERLSMHPFFYNAALGSVREDNVAFGGLDVGADAWLGLRAILTPGVRRIGIGAAVAAGAVVTRDVPDFAVVAGVPARVVRYRFPESVQDAVRASRWWELSVEECRSAIELFDRPLSEEMLRHPLLGSRRR